ncbi:sensor histidine kinase [Paenibacillus sp. 481]|uniref:sensor histidine kinase n=1 Tax=Paenibacillus sp. 481 TaxID=2835869 RepID=UPI001E4372EE|nr:ATP-binding protein [Paenibacillus sp. 481]UHA72625.1 hypothetical protein KIK04_18520 [Paenibacillus sp. 481]
MSAFVKKYDRFIGLSVTLFVLLAIYIHAASFQHPYVGLYIGSTDNGWQIERIDPMGEAHSWPIQQGDTVRLVNGLLPDEMIRSDEMVQYEHMGSGLLLIEHASSISFQRSNEVSWTEDVVLTGQQWFNQVLAIVLESILLAMGLMAYFKKRESYLVRSFFMINVLMAVTILTLFSSEMYISNLILIHCAIWMPYALLSFFIIFVFRSVQPALRRTMLLFRLGLLGLSLFAIVTFIQGHIADWLRGSVHLIFIAMLVGIGIIAYVYWKSLDLIEKNQLLTFVIVLYLSLLPYIFLVAIPDLLWQDYLLRPEYALIGFVLLSAVIMWLLVKRNMLDMRFYMRSIVLHSLYLGSCLLLFVAAAKWERMWQLLLLFAIFAALTYVYQHSLSIMRQKAVSRQTWLQQQQFKLSLQWMEHKNVRGLIRMLADVIDYTVEVEGVCVVWKEPSYATVHGTGKYAGAETTITTITNITNMRDAVYRTLEMQYDFAYIMDLVDPESGDELGYLCIGPKRNQTLFTDEERKLVELVRAETLQLLVNARQLSAMRQEGEQKSGEETTNWLATLQTPQRILEAQQAERMRTSYYLHDHILQNIIFMSRDIEELYATGDVRKARVQAWLSCLYGTQQDIRLLCDDLYPHIIDNVGLKEAVEWHVRSMKSQLATHSIQVELCYELDPQLELPQWLKATLFRINRELINNVFKHGQASAVHVCVWQTAENIHLKVDDNGKGFDVAHVFDDHASQSFGLITIHNQVQQLGGLFRIESDVDKGTCVHVQIPLIKEEGSHGFAHKSDVAG